jgi:hypothetical protein
MGRPTAGRFVALAMIVAGLSAPSAAAAQRRGPERRTLEPFVARYSLDDRVGTSKQNLDAYGLRLQFERVDEGRPTRNLLDRTRGGVFATYSPKQGSPDLSTLFFGVQTDASILPTPLGGALDPFVSFGIGVFRTSRENVVTTNQTGKRIVQTAFSFIPAVGTRVGLIDRVGARVDLRAPFLFGSSTTANFVGEAGVYFSF